MRAPAPSSSEAKAGLDIQQAREAVLSVDVHGLRSTAGPTCIDTYVYVYACMHVCMYVCTYALRHIYIYI